MDDVELFREILTAHGGEPSLPTNAFLSWLRSHPLSPKAITVITGCVLKKSAVIGPIDFYSEKGILEVNGEEAIPVALRDGLLIVGSCPNGDPVAVDVREQIGAVGYIDHENMWQEANVRSAFLVVAPSLGKLAEGLDAEQLPVDYFEAKELEE
jgi:hypothetical protein